MKRPWLATALLSVFVLVPILSAAQEGSAPSVQRSSEGAYLVDGEGRSLYLYLRDGQGPSACTERCAENWPPVVVDGEPVVGERVIGSYVGTAERPDGTMQLTYNGWPLYRYAHDDEAGETFGHGLGDVFYLVAPGGGRIEGDVPLDEQAADAGGEEDTVEGGEDAEAEASPRMQQGQQIFATNCAACHGAEGGGGAGPGFVGNDALGQLGTVIPTILFGRPDHGMPAFADQLDDEQIAAVATYIRNAWGNDYGPVTPEQVSERR